MAEAQFPPPNKVPLSVRVQEIESTRFLAVRKAASEIYLNPDNTPLMSYGDTLLDRQKVKDAVIGYEISKGWVIDDRGQTPQAPAVAAAPTAPVAGFVAQAPIPVPPAAPVVMQPMIPTAPPQAAPAPAAPTAPAPQPPPSDSPMAMPMGKARRGRPAALGSSVAPPPPPPQAVQIQTFSASPAPVAAPVQVIPPPPGLQGPPAPTQAIQPVPLLVPPPPAGAGLDKLAADLANLTQGVGQLLAKGASSDNDFKQVVSNLSSQFNETNKVLAELQAAQKRQDDINTLFFVALHHLYLTVVQSQNKPNTLAEFQELLKQYVPR